MEAGNLGRQVLCRNRTSAGEDEVVSDRWHARDVLHHAVPRFLDPKRIDLLSGHDLVVDACDDLQRPLPRGPHLQGARHPAHQRGRA